MDVRMQEMVLLNIAAQCVCLAETLVDVYCKLNFGSYGAWWYNISRELADYSAGLIAMTNTENRSAHGREHVTLGPFL